MTYTNPIEGSYGGGVDSTTLVEIDLNRPAAAKHLGITLKHLNEVFPSPQSWIFSDPGMEFSQTYEQVSTIANRLGPRFEQVRKEKESLLEFCLRLGCLPLMPGSAHTCSLKWKGEVLQAHAQAKHGKDQPITWIIGIEAEEGSRVKRFQKARDTDNVYLYPLIELGLTRDGCIELLQKLGANVPHKSSCVACPFMSVEEIRESWKNPEAWAIVVEIEDTFKAMSPVKHQAWLDADKPLVGSKRPRAPKGMWRLDSWKEGARLFAKKIDGKQLSVHEWAARFEAEESVQLIELRMAA